MKHNLKTIAKCKDWTSQRIELIEFKNELQQLKKTYPYNGEPLCTKLINKILGENQHE